jgi:TolB protein
MNFPRPASARWLALLTLASLAAFPLRSVSAKKSPPANGMIAYQSTEGGNGFTNDIYVMDADGKHPKRLTNGPTDDDVVPVWSPLGNQIAFLTDRNGSGYEIYLMNADGSNQRPLRTAAEGGPMLGSNVEWSPDGTKLKFINFGRVYVVNAVAGVEDGGGVAVSAAADAFDSEASWSPDGSKLLVVSSCSCGGSPDLYVANVDGSGRTRLTDTPGFEATPRWSPAGGLIAYEADRGGRGIYVANADGTNEHLASGAVGSLGAVAWSPDGSRLAFRSLDGGVYVVKPDGTGLALVSSEPCSGGDIFWSPDGTRIGFNDSGAGGFYDTFVVNSDGSDRKADNYTKTKRADEFACSWQRVLTQ